MLHEQNLLLFAAISAVFAAAGRLVRGVTTSGGIAGAVVCFVLLWAAGVGGFAALLTVFVLTWASTKFGYAKKQRLGTAEARSGRNASQVVANLGIASACALVFLALRQPRWLVAMGAALAEAAADTVSSEIGQALGGEPRVVTHWTRVPVGTNGGVTVAGSAAGILAAAAVALVGYATSMFGFREAMTTLGLSLLMLGAALTRETRRNGGARAVVAPHRN